MIGTISRPSVIVFSPQQLLFRLGLPSGALLALTTAQSGGPTICPIRVCTGHACPGCGMTRAISSMVQGDFAMSWRYHPLALFVALQLVAFWAIAVTGRQTERLMRALPAILAVNGVALVLAWAVRWRLGLLDAVL